MSKRRLFDGRKTIWNISGIRAQLNKEYWEYDSMMEGWVRKVFIGHWCSCVPSGKYYTPWANSNVTEAEAKEDQRWWDKSDQELAQIGCYLDTGEGCATDIFAVEVKYKLEEGDRFLTNASEDGVCIYHKDVNLILDAEEGDA